MGLVEEVVQHIGDALYRREALQALQLPPPVLLGLYGPSGIGKTFTFQEAYRQLGLQGGEEEPLTAFELDPLRDPAELDHYCNARLEKPRIVDDHTQSETEKGAVLWHFTHAHWLQALSIAAKEGDLEEALAAKVTRFSAHWQTCLDRAEAAPNIIVLLEAETRNVLQAVLASRKSATFLEVPFPSYATRHRILSEGITEPDLLATIAKRTNLATPAELRVTALLVRQARAEHDNTTPLTLETLWYTLPAIARAAASEDMHQSKVLPPLFGLQEAQQGLQRLLAPSKEAADRLGLAASRGALLFGPTGSGKTLLLQHTIQKMTAEGFHVISLEPASLLSKYLGETEERLRRHFKKAREMAATGSGVLIVADHFDQLVTRRGERENSLLLSFLTELDGLDALPSNVLFLGATNQPHQMDAALLRPGRIDQLLYCGALDPASVNAMVAPLHCPVDCVVPPYGAEVTGLLTDAARRYLEQPETSECEEDGAPPEWIKEAIAAFQLKIQARSDEEKEEGRTSQWWQKILRRR